MVKVDEVKQALSCLYDPIELSQAALCRYFPTVQRETTRIGRAQVMRSTLLDAVEALQPHTISLPLSPTLRGYELLNLHYVQRLSLAEAAEELAVSPRQAYRDLSEALQRMAEYLDEIVNSQGVPDETPASGGIGEELKSLVAQCADAHIAEILQAAIDIVRPLAQARAISICNEVRPPLRSVPGDPGVLRHLLVSFLSAAVRRCSGGEVIVGAQVQQRSVMVTLRFASESPAAIAVASELMHLCDMQSVRVETSWDAGKAATISLRFAADRQYMVLVIEDNQSVVELYRRMLDETGKFSVIAAAGPDNGQAIAESTQPDAIILDILMPGQDGWTVLRSLRSTPATKDIPVLVCSVFDEPELAAALGANAYLKKPVSRQALVALLQACIEAPDRAHQSPAGGRM